MAIQSLVKQKIKPIEPLLTFYIDLELQFPKKEQNIVQIKNIISKSHLIQKKRMTTFIKHDISKTGYRLYTKGGAEKVNVYCKNYLDPETGEVKPLGDTERYFISDSVQQFNKQMLRSLYICYKDISEEKFENAEKSKNSDGKTLDQYDLIFIACVGIRDSLRNGVKDAVSKCHSAGVNVIMVTGDNIITATAIAKDCGILGKDVNLDNLQPTDIEQEPELTENLEKDKVI